MSADVTQPPAFKETYCENGKSHEEKRTRPFVVDVSVVTWTMPSDWKPWVNNTSE